ncbi:hypothetical protein [Nonomuraea bangladeshensis]
MASDDRDRRDEFHRKIQTVLAAARLVLWMIWEAIDPRHRL